MKGTVNPTWYMVCNLAACLRPTFVIVMDKPLLDSNPQEGNTESYSRSLRASSTLENFRREYFHKFSVVMKITKIFSYENLALYGKRV